MTTFTKIRLNPHRREGRKLLSDPQRMHAAVRAAFPPELDESDARVLWRVDPGEHEHVLYLVGPEKPTGAVLVEQAGWDTLPAQTADYSRFLDKLTRGQRWRFELVANPTYSEFRKGERGKVKAHVSVRHQIGWLYRKADAAGFALAPRVDDEVSDEERSRWSEFDTPQVTERWTDVFHRRKAGGGRSRPVRIAKARFTGTLEVTDPELLRRALEQCIGNTRGYGCGLLTLAPVS